MKIITEIHPDGSVKVRVEGVKGSACKALTKEFEEGLGVITSDVPTKEMHEHEAATIKART